MQVESLLEHGTGVMNEDFLVMENNLFGVFDGATSLTADTYEHGYTGGFLASNLAGKKFRENCGSMTELAKRANMAIRQSMTERNVNLDDKGHLWSTSAAVVRIQDKKLEWAQIGDCQIVCVFNDGNYSFLCDTSEQDVETLSIWKEVGPTTEDPIGVAMKEHIYKVRSRMNVDYGVFSGEPEALKFLNTGSCDLCNIDHVLLFTDGLLLPHATPWEKRNFDEHINLYLKSGLRGVRNRIREIEETDSRCITYPRFKFHDDIAAIAIRV